MNTLRATTEIVGLRHGNRRRLARVFATVATMLATTCSTVCFTAAARGDSAAVTFFEKKIRPLLAENCYTCHSANTNPSSGLRVDDRNGLLIGGGRGPAIVPVNRTRAC